MVHSTLPGDKKLSELDQIIQLVRELDVDPPLDIRIPGNFKELCRTADISTDFPPVYLQDWLTACRDPVRQGKRIRELLLELVNDEDKYTGNK